MKGSHKNVTAASLASGAFDEETEDTVEECSRVLLDALGEFEFEPDLRSWISDDHPPYQIPEYVMESLQGRVADPEYVKFLVQNLG